MRHPHRPGLVPAPATTRADGVPVRLADGATVRSDPALRPAVRWWRRVTEEAYGIDLVPVTDAAADVVVERAGDLPAGAYRLEVGAGDATVRVEAADLAGAHAAVQTLRQLAGPDAYRRAPAAYAGGACALVLPSVRVDDHPRFAWRGVLLDVARHFLPKHDVLRFVDLAAAHRLNVLQLHLTDDQGWRVEVHRYPELTRTGAWRRESTVGTWRTGTRDGRPHGGFYTQDDLREIVAYARDRGVTVVPEIDVPGHVEAAVAAYPELGTRKMRQEVRTTWGISEDVLDPSEGSLAFFRHVLDEVLDVFDTPWIGLGGDEVPTTLWRESPQIVERARALGLLGADGTPDVGLLHGWFVSRLARHVSDAGRRAVVWDEAVSPLLPRDVVVTSWRGHAQGAAALAAGYDVVMAPEQAVYLDHRAGDHPAEPIPVGFLRTVEDVYAFDPFPAALGAGSPPPAAGHPGRLLGVQAQVWTEHLDSARRVDYATFPRLAAFAEVAWSPAADRSPGTPASAEFLERLRCDHLPRLDAYGVEYRPAGGPHPWQTRPGVQGYPRDLAAETAAGGWAGMGGWREDGGVENLPQRTTGDTTGVRGQTG
ncbi:beta-N-acetylhexosaminidase [Promicromonospora citrea]|uniref:beta-N-acetylhexosaminidase n=1 Tax=Promicromonospora citrea TaxID=43677 RepID=A0A8H9GJV9_9MICO|nr:beta-N-acetylhexosaminidase [Promicromonospora citrea]GGM25667.1 beta-N-acetylhexosaminidase [Promicromonospora citrea]